MTDRQYRECPKCHGKGKLHYERRKCPLCGGRGAVRLIGVINGSVPEHWNDTRTHSFTLFPEAAPNAALDPPRPVGGE